MSEPRGDADRRIEAELRSYLDAAAPRADPLLTAEEAMRAGRSGVGGPAQALGGLAAIMVVAVVGLVVVLSRAPSAPVGASPAISETGRATASSDAGDSPRPTPLIVDGWLIPTPYPLPDGAIPLPLETLPPPDRLAIPSGGRSDGCRLARAEADVVYDPGATPPLRFEPDARLVWPYGVSARLYEGRAEIVAPDGSVIGRDGDHLVLAGANGDRGFLVCVPSARPSPAPDDGATAPAATEPPPRWIALPTAPISGRTDYAATWTGSAVFVWGGFEDRRLEGPWPTNDGALYVPEARSWSVTAPSPLTPRAGAQAAMIGERVLVWGGTDGEDRLLDGAFYDPAADRWTPVSSAPIDPDSARTPHAFGVGDEIIVVAFGEGIAAARLDENARWTAIDAPRLEHEVDMATAVWTGSEIVLVLYPVEHAGALAVAYDPAADRWRRLPDPPLSAGAATPAVWTGREVVTFGGRADPPDAPGGAPLGAAVAYDPASDEWRALGGVDDCTTTDAVWTGAASVSIDPARRYDPDLGRCERLPPMPPRGDGSSARESVRPVWTGSSVLVFSGRTGAMPGLLEPDGVELIP